MIMYIEMENVMSSLTKANTKCRHQQGFKDNYVEHTHTHTHTHTQEPTNHKIDW